MSDSELCEIDRKLSLVLPSAYWTSITVRKLVDEAVRLRTENAELKAELERIALSLIVPGVRIRQTAP